MSLNDNYWMNIFEGERHRCTAVLGEQFKTLSCLKPSARMAVSTKFPRISLSSKHSNPQFSRLPNSKTQNFVQIISKNNKFSLRKSQLNSLLNSSSSFTADPNSCLSQLCTQNELNQAVNVLASVCKELPTDIEDETFVALVRLCEYKRASAEGSFIFTHLSLRLGNALLSMFVRLGIWVANVLIDFYLKCT